MSDALREKLQDVHKGLESLNDTAIVSREGGDNLDVAEAYAVQRELRKKFGKMNTSELGEALDIQAGRETGKQASADILNRLAAANPNITKLLDSSGGTALIRQDLEPILYSLFVKRFPFSHSLSASARSLQTASCTRSTSRPLTVTPSSRRRPAP